MSQSALRRLSQQVPRLTRGLKTSSPVKKGTEKYSHDEIVYGDGHHGLRPGYHYVSELPRPLLLSCLNPVQDF